MHLLGDKILIRFIVILYLQLSQIGGDALTIAVIPGDVGKPTTRLEKAKVKDGTCYWEKPHFETVKYTRDQKTGKINERIYRFIVATVHILANSLKYTVFIINSLTWIENGICELLISLKLWATDNFWHDFKLDSKLLGTETDLGLY